jgi:p-methyltransferase
MNKKVTPRRYRAAMKELHDRGIITFVSLICGFPGETEDSVQRTIDFMNETEPTYYDIELYYHSSTAPIHRRSEEFGIKGAGYGWSHNTMKWSEAFVLLEKMHREIDGATIMPEQSFSMYAIPYLLGQGMTMKQIHGFCAIVHSMYVKSLTDEVKDTSIEESVLRDFLSRPDDKGQDALDHRKLKVLGAELQARIRELEARSSVSSTGLAGDTPGHFTEVRGS